MAPTLACLLPMALAVQGAVVLPGSTPQTTFATQTIQVKAATYASNSTPSLTTRLILPVLPHLLQPHTFPRSTPETHLGVFGLSATRRRPPPSPPPRQLPAKTKTTPSPIPTSGAGSQNSRNIRACTPPHPPLQSPPRLSSKPEMQTSASGPSARNPLQPRSPRLKSPSTPATTRKAEMEGMSMIPRPSRMAGTTILRRPIRLALRLAINRRTRSRMIRRGRRRVRVGMRRGVLAWLCRVVLV